MKSRLPTAKSGAVIYCRVSTKEQADNFSLETQEKACKALCEREGLTVLAIFSEAESAKSLDRAQFQAMQDYCLAYRKQIAAVVVYNVSRFSRVTSDHLTVKLILHKLGIALQSVTEPLTDDPVGRYMETVMSAQAQFDNEVKADRTRQGMTTAVMSGKWVHRAPLGYRSSKLPGGLAPDADRADLIRRAFEMFASEALSNAGILETVTRLGLCTSNGKPLSLQSFDNLLKNPVYAGIISIPSWGLEAKGKFQPLIDEELYARVRQRLNAKRIPLRQSELAQQFPLRVFARCSRCDQGLTGSFSTGRHGGKYGYYSCRVPGCGAVRFKRMDLHATFLNLLRSLQLCDEAKPVFRKAIRYVWKQKAAEKEDVVAKARKRVGELKRYQEKVIQAWINENITKDVYDDQMAKVGTDLAAAGLLEGEAVLGLAEVELSGGSSDSDC